MSDRLGVAGQPEKAADPIQAAIDELAAPSPETRVAAANRLAPTWPSGARAAPFLAIALEDEDARVREGAFEALRRLSEPAIRVTAANLDDFLGQDVIGPRDGRWTVTPFGLASYLLPQRSRRSRSAPRPVTAAVAQVLLTAAAVLPLGEGTTRHAERIVAEDALVLAAAAQQDHDQFPNGRGSAPVVLRALEVARTLGFGEPVAVAPAVRVRLVQPAASDDPLRPTGALRLLRLARATGDDVRDVALHALVDGNPAVATALVLAAQDGSTPLLVTRAKTVRGLGSAVPELEELGAWWLLEAMLENPDRIAKRLAARVLVARGRATRAATSALTEDYADLAAQDAASSPFDVDDGRLRAVVAAIVAFDPTDLPQLERIMRRAEAPRKFALADALAHASPSSAEAARHVEARFQEFRGEVPPEGFAWLRDALLAVDEGESGLERAKSRWRDPRLDLTGIRRAAAALARLVAAGAAVAADVEAALVGVSACPGDGRRSLPEPGRPTLRSIDLWSHHADDRFRSLRVLLDLLGGFGPAAQATVPEIERVRRAESDERVAHVAARALRRIAAK